MKIVVISSHTPSLFWFRIDMMKEFIKKGNQVIAYGSEEESNWKSQFNNCGIEYKSYPVSRNGINPFKDITTLISLIKMIKEDSPDILFTYQAKPIVYGNIAAKIANVKSIYSLIAGLGSIFRGNGIKNRILLKVMKLQYKYSLKYASKVIFQNNDDLNEFLINRIIPKEKAIIVNGSGVDIAKFNPTSLPEKTSFLFIGRLIKDKGIIEYLEACKKIKSLYPDVKCMLVGPFDTNPTSIGRSELQNYIDQEIIEFYGEQLDVRPYIDKASVFVLPSYHEGTPKTVLESMAMGRAIITTNAPGCRETVINNENGILVPVKSINKLTDAMIQLIENPDLVREMGKKSRRISETKYDVNIVNKNLMEIMNLK